MAEIRYTPSQRSLLASERKAADVARRLAMTQEELVEEATYCVRPEADGTYGVIEGDDVVYVDAQELGRRWRHMA